MRLYSSAQLVAGRRVIFYRVRGHRPIFLAQFDEALRQPHGVLEFHVGIDHAVADEERAFQAFCEEDGTAAAVGLGVGLRRVQDVRGVAVVVSGPIGDGAEGGSGGEDVGLGEHRHQGDEAAVAAAVEADLLGVGAMLRDGVFGGVHDIVEIFAAHVLVDGGAPVAAVAGGAAVIHVEDEIAALLRKWWNMYSW